MEYIPVSLRFFRHPKVLKAAVLSGLKPDIVGLRIIKLWVYTLEYYPSGEITELVADPTPLSEVWDCSIEEAGAFLQILIDRAWIDALCDDPTAHGPRPTAFHIHHWHEHGAGRSIRGRKAHADYQRQYRARATTEQLTVDSQPSGQTTNPKPQTTIPKAAPCPFEQIVAAYNANCQSLKPYPFDPNDEAREKVRARWQKHPDINWFVEYFKSVEASDFLTGRTKGDRPFKATFIWLMGREHMQRVMAGNYDNREEARVKRKEGLL